MCHAARFGGTAGGDVGHPIVVPRPAEVIPAEEPLGGLQAFAAMRERLATAAQDGVVRIWRPGAPGEAPRELRGHEGEVVAVAFTPTGEHVLSASLDRTARLWPTDGGAPAVVAMRPPSIGAADGSLPTAVALLAISVLSTSA